MTTKTTKSDANLETMRLPELWALYADTYGTETRCPNKRWLVRKLKEAASGGATAEEMSAGEKATDGEGNDDSEAVQTRAALPRFRDIVTASGDDGDDDDQVDDNLTGGDANETEEAPLTKLTLEELQQRHLDVIGRPTRGTSRRYLIWRLQQAQKGRVAIGERASKAAEPKDMMVLPLRMERETVEAMDDAWKRLGLKSRTDLLRCALRAYFLSADEPEVAARV